MNLRNWTKGHSYGLLIGIITTIICIPLVLFILSQVENQSYASFWNRFAFFDSEKGRILSLASIGNLVWFHIFYRMRKDAMSMGIILATVLNLLIILYFKFIA